MTSKSRISKSRKTKKQRSRQHSTREGTRSRHTRPKFIKFDDSKTGFADLPPELRNLIYEYALSPRTSNIIPLSLGSQLGIRQDIAINLLATCKVIHKEATALFFSQNYFRIDLFRNNEPYPKKSIVGPSYDLSAANRRAEEFELEVKEWEDQSMPQLSNALELISPRNLALMNKLVFTCYCSKHAPLLCHPELTIELEFLKNSPYFKFRSSKGDASTLDNLAEQDTSGNQVVSDDYLTYVAAMIQAKNLRSLGKNDILDFARWIIRYHNNPWADGGNWCAIYS